VRVWDPSLGASYLTPASELVPIHAAPLPDAHVIAVAAVSSRIHDAVAKNLLLSPSDVPLTPLPHQIHALRRAMASDPVRMLLADEVGLGKTIEAGLIIRELKLRGKARRVLVVAPRGLTLQWVAEMRAHFGEEFELVMPSEVLARHGSSRAGTLWHRHDQVVTSMDAIKPIASRAGWTEKQVEAYNRDRFRAVVEAGWDLIVVDEAHRLAGASEGVARYELARELAKASPHLLLLSATPHNGDTEAFHRLISLLDERAFPSVEAVTRERVSPYVVRTEKRTAVDLDGRPLFVPRFTRPVRVSWGEGHEAEKALYEAVTEYVREGYARALRERSYGAGFLMVLFQRLVTSSTRAIRRALERRLEVISGEMLSRQQQLLLEEEYDEMIHLVGSMQGERSEVEGLIELARVAEAAGLNAKAEALLDLLVEVERQELDPDLKVLVFTEFTATQEMLRELLESVGYSVVTLNGMMDLDERLRVQREFAGDARVLISTDAGGEGLNLQFCHVVVNYDLPWNPMRIEQRIGRVDRIGQKKPVRAFNMLLESSIEHRVQELLEIKLQQILDDLGVDKLSDVLDSGEATADFERLYVDSLLDPGHLEARVEEFAQEVGRRARATREGSMLLSSESDASREHLYSVEHTLPRWVEALTVHAALGGGGEVVRRARWYEIYWPDGERWPRVLFDRSGAEEVEGAQVVSLVNDRIQGVLRREHVQVPGQPVAQLRIRGLPPGVGGFWSLWKLEVVAGPRRYRRYLPLFLHDDGRWLLPSARRIWDLLCLPDTKIEVTDVLPPEHTGYCWELMSDVAREHAASLLAEVEKEHEIWLARERDNLETYRRARHKTLMSVGLETVRQHRQAMLERELGRLQAELEEASNLLCELDAVLLLRVEAEDD